MYFEFLREEFKVKGSKNALRPEQLQQLAVIRDSIKTGKISKNHWVDELTAYCGSSDTPAEHTQKELVQNLDTTCRSQLADILADDLYLYNVEHPCGVRGRIDMVYMGKNTVYPVEVKKDKGEHDLIGQIAKYDLHHKLQLHYKLYQYVQSITICRSYNQQVADTLKSIGIVTLLYSGELDSLKLTRI